MKSCSLSYLETVEAEGKQIQIHSAPIIIIEYSIKPKRLEERRTIHYPNKRIIGLYIKNGKKTYR